MTAAADTCTVSGKIRYATRSGAYIAARHMNKRKPATKTRSAPCDIYKCTACHGFHLGHHNLVPGLRGK